MNFEQYKDHWRKDRKHKPNPAIIERWNTRILPDNLHLGGPAGGEMYLSRYGKNIGSAKCIMFARYAESLGHKFFAEWFWEKAYSIDHPEKYQAYVSGQLEPQQDAQDAILPDNPITHTDGIIDDGHARASAMQDLEVFVITPKGIEANDFPTNLQPGQLVTMQPSDAVQPRDYYVNNPNYWGQPKRDGNKLVIFASPDKVWYQSRQLKVNSAPSIDMDNTLKYIAKQLGGSYILEGELYFMDVEGKEHMTGETCRARNEQLANEDPRYSGDTAAPRMRFAAFGCLYTSWSGEILKKSEQWRVGSMITTKLFVENPDIFDQEMPTARTQAEKQYLVEVQEKNQREGEVWFLHYLDYRSGKITSSKDPQYDGYVRTKYRTDPIRAKVLNVLPSRAAGHHIGGIQVEYNGKDVGRIGTGYTREQQAKILLLWQEAEHLGRSFEILITTQGWTTYGNLRHGSFYGFLED